VDGTVTANGSQYYYHSGGAGGSIWIQAGGLAGSGTIQANGAGNGAGGGGGRIALYYQTNSFSGAVQAFGGPASAGGQAGGAGTVYWKGPTGALGYVVVDNHSQAGAYTPADLILGTNLVVVVTNGTQIGVPGGETWTVGQLVLGSGSTVWCLATNAAGQVSNQWVGAGAAIQAQSLTIQTGAVISAEGQGYPPLQGPGAAAASSWAAGGGHGGLGGTVNGNGGGAYGSVTQPTELGSGGSDGGSPGGGAIRLIVAGTLQVDGTIAADGLHVDDGAGGSGGSIWITAGTLAGGGTIQADGAIGHANGGGGGRVAVYCQENAFAGAVTARGGAAIAQTGGAGTVCWQVAKGTLRVLVDNAGQVGAYTPTDLIEGTNLVVTVTNGAQVSIAGGETWSVNQLLLATNGTVVCFSANAGGLVNSQWLGTGVVIQAQSVVVQPGGVITADGLGYAPLQGPGAAAAGSWAGGGGHGGLGGTVNGNGGGAYGSVTQPTELGSGGSDGGSPGGGAIELVVNGTLEVDGVLTASGFHTDDGAGGAGGSIWITAGTLAGGGTIQANGAMGHANGGGGGRIALYCRNNLFAGAITAAGGPGIAQTGGAGTVYWQSPTNALGYVLVDNDGQTGIYTPADLIEGTNLVVTVTNGAQVSIAGGETWTVNQLLLATNGAVLCFSINNTGLLNSQWLGTGVVIQAQSLVIQPGGVVTADGLGYVPGQGPGAATSGSWGGGAAGHGGLGGTAGGGGGGAYGSLTQPTELGSGGWAEGNSGGGAIQLVVAGTLRVDGSITANAGNPGNAGGGAGGSIWIQAGTLAGSGTIQANGANGGGNGNGGGGGRIAIYYQANAFAGAATAWGGRWAGAGAAGGAGTVYWQGATGLSSYVLDNGGHAGAYTPADAIQGANLALTVTNGAQASIPGGETWTVGQLVIGSGGTVWCQSTNAAGQVSNQWAGAGVVIQAQSVAINAGGVLSADGFGYGPGQGPGAGAYLTRNGGGGHGGQGGTWWASGGAAYGSLTQPVELGSGGSDPNSSGGGAIRLVVTGALQVDGTITAGAVDGANGTYGGSAGGSIWIGAGSLAGSGTIQANGSRGEHNGGGGGRIAMHYQTRTFTGTATAWGGNGVFQGGGAGTIYWEGSAGTLDSVVLDNGGLIGAYTPADLLGGMNLLVTVTNGAQASLAGGQSWSVNQLLLATNSTVWCFSANNTGPVNSQWLGTGVVIQAQSVLIQSGAALSADGLGYVSGQGPGTGAVVPWGAGHGGQGGTHVTSGSAAYGFC